MTKVQLVAALRLRLAEKCKSGEFDRTLPGGRSAFLCTLWRTSDEVLIGGYLICSVCAGATISIQQAVRLAEHCKTVDDWMRSVAAWEQLYPLIPF